MWKYLTMLDLYFSDNDTQHHSASFVCWFLSKILSLLYSFLKVNLVKRLKCHVLHTFKLIQYIYKLTESNSLFNFCSGGNWTQSLIYISDRLYIYLSAPVPLLFNSHPLLYFELQSPLLGSTTPHESPGSVAFLVSEISVDTILDQHHCCRPAVTLVTLECISCLQLCLDCLETRAISCSSKYGVQQYSCC